MRCSTRLKADWGTIDFLVHAIGFSDKNELRGRYVDTSLDNFLLTMNVSVFSFTAIAQRALPMMPEGGSLLTLSYYGAEKVIPHYNVMGVAKAALETSVKYLAMDLGPQKVRVNAISAGPIKTLAASGIGDFRYILKWNEYNAPLRRNVTIEDVGGAGALSAQRPVIGRDGRNPPCRCRLQRHRHEGRRRAGHERGDDQHAVPGDRPCPDRYAGRWRSGGTSRSSARLLGLVEIRQAGRHWRRGVAAGLLLGSRATAPWCRSRFSSRRKRRMSPCAPTGLIELQPAFERRWI